MRHAERVMLESTSVGQAPMNLSVMEGKGNSKAKFEGKCWVCGKKGHSASYCWSASGKKGKGEDKGKGKGAKGKGKGATGKGKGTKGKGQGSRWEQEVNSNTLDDGTAQ